MLTVVTGIPYLGIAEYSYGISDKFTAGVLAGRTPTDAGYGLRIRGVVFQGDEDFRVHFRMPVIYYPTLKGKRGEPWLLAWPVVSAEWKLNSGTRLSVGGGVIGASCVASLLGKEEEDEEGFMNGLWNTLQFGVAVPLKSNLAFQAEVAGVLSGLKLAGKDWIGGPPVIVTLGLSHSF